LIVAGSDDLTAQSVLFASARNHLLGEEIYSAPAYFYMYCSPTNLGSAESQTEGLNYQASLFLQDVLRWLLIICVFAGLVIKFIR